MAKWFGKIGFATLSEAVPGVWEDRQDEICGIQRNEMDYFNCIC